MTRVIEVDNMHVLVQDFLMIPNYIFEILIEYNPLAPSQYVPGVMGFLYTHRFPWELMNQMKNDTAVLQTMIKVFPDLVVLNKRLRAYMEDAVCSSFLLARQIPKVSSVSIKLLVFFHFLSTFSNSLVNSCCLLCYLQLIAHYWSTCFSYCLQWWLLWKHNHSKDHAAP